MNRKYLILDKVFDCGYIKSAESWGNCVYTKDKSEAKVYDRLGAARKDCKTACVMCNSFVVVDAETGEEV